MSKKKFKTEVDQLLNLITHSLYSNREIFVRELVSNSSDALDKLKFMTLTDEKFKSLVYSPRVDISFDSENKSTLTISDNGIGMNKKDLDDNLGTIARSGTKKFVQQLTGDQSKDSNLIGQFGVGFYSSFMVADKVEVISRKAGEDEAWLWTSDGRSGYEVEEAKRPEGHGTTVTLFLNDDGLEFASRWRIENIIKKYSNHVPFPIYLHFEDTKFEGEGDDKKEIKEQKEEQLNLASALWKQSKSKLKDEDYNEFYKNMSFDNDDPLLTIHTQAEGKLDYTTLFFIPKKAPMDLYNADYTPGVKLYVKRVFITDDAKELMPVYLRFVKGIIDSEDLPLNVSREILQHNRVLEQIRRTSVKKVLSEIAKMMDKDREKYLEFYKEFGRPIKEGLYQDFENKDKLTELVMFKSTKVEGYTSLAEYVERMGEEQKSIFYITGTKEHNLRESPLLEMYKKKEIEVLILDDEIDEIIISSIPKYKDFDMKSVNRSSSADELKTDDDKKDEESIAPVIEKLKKSLGDLVKDVKPSVRLSDSPSCIVADENDPTSQMQHIMKMMGQNNPMEVKPILEINPKSSIVKSLGTIDDEGRIDDISRLLLDQAMLLEGVELKSMPDFVKRLNRVMENSI